MKKYTIEYTTDAGYDLISISTGIISEYSDPYGAKKTTDRIIAKCERLSSFPRGTSAKTIIDGEEIRFAHIKHFIIIYHIDETNNTVIIQRIVGSRQDLSELLK